MEIKEGERSYDRRKCIRSNADSCTAPMRKYAKLLIKIWRPASDFLDLDDDSKLLYLQLISAPELENSGVAPYAPALYASRQKRLTQRKFVICVNELVREGYLIVDKSHGLILVRSFIRHDHLLGNENLSKSLADSLKRVTSPALRQEIARELARIYKESPALKGWGVIQETDPEMMSTTLGIVHSPPKETKPDMPETPEGRPEGRKGTASATAYPHGVEDRVWVGGY